MQKIELDEHAEWVRTMAQLVINGIQFKAYKECGMFYIDIL